MKKNNKLQKIKVYWTDAVIYSASSVEKKLELKPTRKITEGIFEKEIKEGIIVKDPYTTNEENGKRDFREETKKATFLFIPNGMIAKKEILQILQ